MAVGFRASCPQSSVAAREETESETITLADMKIASRLTGRA